MPGSSYIAALSFLRRRAAFSLVEMLAVMAIIVLLLAATLPAMRGLNQSESRRGAVGNMMSVLDRARMMAISDGLSTYVVFACKTPGSPQISTDLWGHSYAIYQDGDNVSFTPVQKTPWMSLPKGLAFKVSEDMAGTNSTAHSILTCFAGKSPQDTDPAFPLANTVKASPGDTGGVKLPYWKFDSTGIVTVPASIQAPQKTDDYMKVLIFPGFVDANGNEISTQNTSSAGGNKQPLQLEEIDVTPATGRAKYIIDPTNNLSTPSSTP